MFRTSGEKWRQYRQWGRPQFVLRVGVLGWGLPTATIFALIRGYLDGWDEFLPHLLTGLIMFPLIGILVGQISWRRLKRQHDSQQTSQNGRLLDR